jgi:hypothetical protein
MITRTLTTLTRNQIQVLMLKLKLIPKLRRMETLFPILLTEPTFQENHILLTLTTLQLLSDNLPTDGKVTPNTPPIPRLLDLREGQTKQKLLFKRKSTQMLQMVLFHKRLTINMTVSNNSRNHLTLKTQQTRMISKTSTTQTSSQVQVLITKRKVI